MPRDLLSNLIGEYGGTEIQLSLEDVRNVWLAVPPLDEQIEIADFLDWRLSKIDLSSTAPA